MYISNFEYIQNLIYTYLLFTDLNVEQQILKTDTIINQSISPKYYNKYVCFFARHDELVNYDIIMNNDQINNIEHYSYNGIHGTILFNFKIINFIKSIILKNNE